MANKNDYHIKSMDRQFVHKQSVVNFKCSQCGACCRNIAPKDKIILSSVDLYRIANVLDMEITDVIGKYCDMVPGGESMLPLLILKERMDRSCIFLKKGKCSVEEGKPVMCALHPLGRMLLLNEETGEQEFHYHVKDFECAASKDEGVTVQDWLDHYHIEEYDECSKLHKRIGSACSKLMHAARTMEERREMFSTAFYLMYAKISKDGDLYGQLAQNFAFIQSMNPEVFFNNEKMN